MKTLPDPVVVVLPAYSPITFLEPDVFSISDARPANNTFLILLVK